MPLDDSVMLRKCGMPKNSIFLTAYSVVSFLKYDGATIGHQAQKRYFLRWHANSKMVCNISLGQQTRL